MTTLTPHPGRRLREAWQRGTVMVPGAFNALVARAVAQAGFEACYISGGATANACGYPDIGLVSLTEMARTTSSLALAVPTKRTASEPTWSAGAAWPACPPGPICATPRKPPESRRMATRKVRATRASGLLGVVFKAGYVSEEGKLQFSYWSVSLLGND